jgi:hypothetical protein
MGEWLRGLVIGGRPDLGDGLATTAHPVVGPLVMAHAAVGLGFAVVRAKRPEYAVLVAAALILPLGAILTVEDGLFRRTLGLAPIVAVLAAIPLAAIWEQLRSRRERSAIAGLTIVVAAVALLAAKDVYDYFGPVQDTETMRFVYPAEIDAASHYIDDLPSGTVVYFYSDRWSINYETAVFIAPDPRPMFDRSIEFRNFPAPETDDPVSLDIERTRADGVAMVFTGNYLPFAEEALRRHPGGTLTERTHEDRILFLGYYLPPDEDASAMELP